MLGLYLHVPFCQAICSYCHFNRGLYDADLAARYVGALEREVRTAGDGRPVDTVYFGGGTPSILEPAAIGTVLRACRDAYNVADDAEVTLETNPETASVERLEAFLAAGVNRFSFGVQSFDDGELARLERVHSAARAAAAVEAARRAGSTNVSIDLMLWLPGQSAASWRRTVEQAIALSPDHISMYLLELYPNAPLREAMARQGAPDIGDAGDWQQIAEDQAADMYLEGLERFDRAGYQQYEISNIARPGYSSRHNLKYWQGGAWQGFGCGAHSTVDGTRWRNVSATAEYVARVRRGDSVRVDVRQLSIEAQAQEGLFMGLRLAQGVSGRTFRARFGVDPWARHRATLEPCVAEGLAWRRDEHFGLTRRGMLVANEILAEFV